MKYICEVCGYVYDPAEGDPDSGIEPGTAFEDSSPSKLTLNAVFAGFNSGTFYI